MEFSQSTSSNIRMQASMIIIKRFSKLLDSLIVYHNIDCTFSLLFVFHWSTLKPREKRDLRTQHIVYGLDNLPVHVLDISSNAALSLLSFVID